MNTNILHILRFPSTWTALWGLSTILIQNQKKQIINTQVYQHLKSDIVQVHNQSLDLSQSKPIIHLLKKKGNQLQPSLKEKLQLFQQWTSDNQNKQLKYLGIIVSSSLASTMFPKLAIGFMVSVSLMSSISYYNGRQILSGGRQKSYLKKQSIPKDSDLLKIYTYGAIGLASLALFKIGMVKYNTFLTSYTMKHFKDSATK